MTMRTATRLDEFSCILFEVEDNNEAAASVWKGWKPGFFGKCLLISIFVNNELARWRRFSTLFENHNTMNVNSSGSF